MADCSRSEVYAAERMAFDGTDLEEPHHFEMLEQLAASILGDPWWSGGPVEIRPARRSSSSSTARWVPGDAHRVTIAQIQSTPATLVHELAHVLAGVRSQHGPPFRRAHVDLARVAFGVERSEWLAVAYRSAGLPLGERSWPDPPPATGAIAL